jgi:hypothetical protein
MLSAGTSPDPALGPGALQTGDRALAQPHPFLACDGGQYPNDRLLEYSGAVQVWRPRTLIMLIGNLKDAIASEEFRPPSPPTVWSRCQTLAKQNNRIGH